MIHLVIALLLPISGVWAASHPTEYLSIDREGGSAIRPIRVNSASPLNVGEKIRVSTTLQGNRLTTDASMVLSGADYNLLLRQSRDFGHYVQMRMPNLVDSRVVIPAAEGSHEFITWAHMETQVGPRTQSSKHFMQVRLTDGLNEQGGEGQTWVQYHPTQTERTTHHISVPDESTFIDFEGAWYSQRLPNGNVYCRYYLAGILRGGIPFRHVGGARLAMSKFGSGVYDVMLRLVELQQQDFRRRTEAPRHE